MSKKKPFVFNDESIYNAYGFRTLNAGIDLTRFINNPVMLDGHWASNENVIGRWENFGVDGVILSGEPVFDVADEKAKKIAGKVDRDFIKSCSMGLLFNPSSMELEPNGKWALTECELLEVSIVAIPANANAIRLYVEKDGKFELMKEDEVKMCLSAFNSDNNFSNKKDNNNMKKVFLSVAALVVLGLDKNTNPAEGVDANIVEDAINGLKSQIDNSALKLSATEAALKAYKDVETANLTATIKEFVDSVIPSKYDEAERETVTKLATADLSFAKKIAEQMPAKTTLSTQVNNTEEKKTSGEVKTMDDFQKLNDQAQLAFKNANPEAYKKIVAES